MTMDLCLWIGRLPLLVHASHPGFLLPWPKRFPLTLSGFSGKVGVILSRHLETNGLCCKGGPMSGTRTSPMCGEGEDRVTLLLVTEESGKAGDRWFGSFV